MIGAPDFSVFSVKSAVSNIRDGVAEALRADPQIAEFLDATYDEDEETYGTDGRIYVSPTPIALPDKPIPYCAVYTVRERRGKLLGREVEIFATIGISLVWDETREVLEPGNDRTAEDFFNRVYAVLAADQYLELVPLGQTAKQTTGKGLADSLLDSEAQDLSVLAAKDDGVTVEKALFMNWSTTASITTGTPQ